MNSENIILGVRALDAYKEIDSNKKVGLTEKYEKLVKMVKNRDMDIERDGKFVSDIFTNFSGAMLGDENGFLGDTGKNSLDNEVYGIFKLVTINVPRQVAFAKKFKVSMDETCEFESLMYLTAKQQSAQNKSEKSSIATSAVDDIYDAMMQEAGFYSLFVDEYKSMNDDQKSMFSKYVDFSKQFSKSKLENASLSLNERIVNKDSIAVCDLAMQNIGEMNCECVAE